MILERKNHQLEDQIVATSDPGVSNVETGVGVATVRVVTVDELQERSRLHAALAEGHRLCGTVPAPGHDSGDEPAGYCSHAAL